MAVFLDPVKTPPNFKGNFGEKRKNENGEESAHPGTDIPVPSGTPVKAPLNGKVVNVKSDEYPCGGTIDIDYNNGYWSRFCHIKKIDVSVGDVVNQGQVVGLSGGGANDFGKGKTTGPHLHYTLRYKGENIDPVLVRGKDVDMIDPESLTSKESVSSERKALDAIFNKLGSSAPPEESLLGSFAKSMAKGFVGVNEEVQRIKELMK